MAITRDDVDRVARLARLYLSDDERAELTDQLGRIVDFVDQLNEVDTADVKPMAHAGGITNAFAADVAGRSLDREAALGNAPSRDESCFRVPAVLGE
jgi:aspartyl-tRNA(Asn)/glutamyl-tRNA(Gln) amidotransferase subunit C